MMSLRLARLAVAAVLSMGMAAATWAGQASAGFLVTAKPIGLCINTSLSQNTQALVKVTCEGGQFVSIEPREGRPFLGTHGGAYRFVFSQTVGIPDFLSGGSVDGQIGQGTITALRVLNLTERDQRLELLVFF